MKLGSGTGKLLWGMYQEKVSISETAMCLDGGVTLTWGHQWICYSLNTFCLETSTSNAVIPLSINKVITSFHSWEYDPALTFEPNVEEDPTKILPPGLKGRVALKSPRRPPHPLLYSRKGLILHRTLLVMRVGWEWLLTIKPSSTSV